MSAKKDCCVGEPGGGDPHGLHSWDCPEYLAFVERLEARRAEPVPAVRSDLPPTGSTSAQLRQAQAAFAASQADLTRVVAERDELKLALAAALDDRDWADRMRADGDVQAVADANDLLRAELASARTELALLRTRLHTQLHTTEEEADV
ncbi:hypothetical protein [Actinoplanes sp. NPDC049118]|uniref:hypothetical protein n=1 Tax=Actinoplanes sp. NPDC049118 TaxID=3155769 RepID=UPI0033D48B0E